MLPLALIALGVAVPTSRALSLAEALALAEANDQRLEVTRVDEELAGWRAHEQLARALPVVEVGAVATQNPKAIERSGSVISPAQSAQGSAQAHITLFDGAVIPEVLAAYGERTATVREREEARDALRADVASLYLALAEAQELEEAHARALATADELVRMAEARVRFEQGVQLEVDEARAEALRATANLARARGVTRQVAALLALRLGLSSSAELRARCDECLSSAPPPSVGPLVARGDLLGQRLRVDAAAMRGLGGWLDFLPSLAVVGNVRLQEPTFFQPEPVWWTAQLVVSWTLFEGTGRIARRFAQGALERRAALAAELAEREAEVAAEQARVAVSSTTAAHEAARARAEVAGRALEQAQLRYREGLLSSVGVTEAARRKADADAQAIENRFAAYRASLSLRRALGLGVLDDGERGS